MSELRGESESDQRISITTTYRVVPTDDRDREQGAWSKFAGLAIPHLADLVKECLALPLNYIKKIRVDNRLKELQSDKLELEIEAGKRKADREGKLVEDTFHSGKERVVEGRVLKDEAQVLLELRELVLRLRNENGVRIRASEVPSEDVLDSLIRPVPEMDADNSDADN